MAIGTLAIAGTPGLSGFFSKDEILWRAFSSPHGHILLWILGVAVAGTTAFYMFRMLFMTFYGESHVDHHTEQHIHESPRTMTIPLMVLAFGSIVAGWVGIPAWLGGSNIIERWLEPVFEPIPIAVAAVAARTRIQSWRGSGNRGGFRGNCPDWFLYRLFDLLQEERSGGSRVRAIQGVVYCLVEQVVRR
jgi:NADH:ubiquinone oxidoreductase subunit 5 (subunit L)/multisubunit Na+/H+ antiporter MnhA subunit